MSDRPHEDDVAANTVESALWIQQQPLDVHISLAEEGICRLLEDAAQPKSLSGPACLKLCSLLDQSAKSQSAALRKWAFSQDVIARLFDFYLNWNESGHVKSMRTVLDTLTSLLAKNPDVSVATGSKAALLNTLVPIVVGKSTKPAAKTSLKILEHFLTKDILSLSDLKTSFIQYRPEAAAVQALEVWRLFVADLFRWMYTQFVRPQAGRLMAVLYWRLARDEGSDIGSDAAAEAWQQWLAAYLKEDTNLLEPIRNYIFLPLFTNHKTEGIQFLKKVAEKGYRATPADTLLDSSTLLRLAALGTGKKVGLVEEPTLDTEQIVSSETIVLRNSDFEGVLAHTSHELRSVAFILLITCPSTTKPFSYAALELLRKHLPTFFADADPKFRVDISGRVRDIFKRVRGAICVLKRSIPRVRAKARKAAAAAAGKPESGALPLISYHSNLIELPEHQLIKCLEYHEDFLRWYMRFLCDELIPTASYQRHAASLRALHYILRVEADPHKTWQTPEDQTVFFDLLDSRWARALLDLTLDPFEDVRDFSAKALTQVCSDGRYRKFAVDSADQAPLKDLELHLKRANDQAKRTARVDDSDGAARTFQSLYTLAAEESERTALLKGLVEELERRIGVAQVDLGRAVLEAPLHGIFSSICYTWQVVTEQRLGASEKEAAMLIQERLVTCCERVWASVQQILCDDSPEGHLPDDLDDVEGLDTKDLLSYCFRAAEESSNLMRIIILALKYSGRETSLYPSPELFERIGTLTSTQLATLRHRGAFTAVSATFAACCQRTKFIQDEGRSYLAEWYAGTLKVIHSQRSTTRRSAGIPSMITGILSASASEPSFEAVVEELMSIASIPAMNTEASIAQLPQVHAFNCLKEIYKNALLASAGNKSEKYLPACLELAANGLRSEVWAIRNCGLIFLRSLIDSLFGNQESKAMIEAGWDGKANRIPYHRYPTLPTVLVNLLKSGHRIMAPMSSKSSAAAEAVFPALDIIRRAGPPDLYRDDLQELISLYLASPVWHVREIAARTLCSCLLHEKWLDTISELIHNSVSGAVTAKQNQCHGVLLTLKFVIERLGEVASDQLRDKLPQLIELLVESRLETLYSFSPEVVASYLEVVNMVWAYQHVSEQPLAPLALPSDVPKGGALQRKQRAISEAYLATRSENPILALTAILFNDASNADVKIAVLEVLPSLWPIQTAPRLILIGLCDIYLTLCLESRSKEVQTQALLGFGETWDRLQTCSEPRGEEQLYLRLGEILSSVWELLPSAPLNPSLGNAVVRASGSVIATLSRSTEGRKPLSLAKWGAMVAEAGRDVNDFDARYAAAESLRSYFAGKTFDSSTQTLPALLALYDSLNDDDDDIRNVGSEAASHILGDVLVPLEAASRLLDWLVTNYAQDAAFRAIVYGRIIGESGPGLQPRSASEQLATALKLNDSLFAVEDQNLFIDEVRETKHWAAVYASLEGNEKEAAHAELEDWLEGGILEMQRLVQEEDGPLGWASQPDVYAICSRILIGAVAVAPNATRVRASLKKLKSLRKIWEENKVSPLLVAPLDMA